MRWSQGVWSEKRIVQAVNATDEFFAIPYGPSGAAPSDDIREFELYFERLEAAGLKESKRPDVLIFEKSSREEVDSIVHSARGISQLPFMPESHAYIKELLGKAIAAVECENSLWKAKKMPDYGKELKPQRRLGGRLGLGKSAVLPTVILKKEDREKLQKWQDSNRVSVHIWHVFYDIAFGISFLLMARKSSFSRDLFCRPSKPFKHPAARRRERTFIRFITIMHIVLAAQMKNPS